MRVLITTGIFPPDIGGPANYVPRVADWLTRQGHAIDVVCWSDVLEHGNFKFRVTRIPRNASSLHRFFLTVKTITNKAHYADVIFANGLPLQARIAAVLAAKPIVHKIVGDSAWERAVLRSWFAGTIDDYQVAPKAVRLRMLDVLRNAAYVNAACIITPSHYLARIVDNWGIRKARITTVYNSTATTPRYQQVRLPAYDGHTIATVCRLVPWKGVDGIISLLPELQNTRLIIAGDGPMRGALEALANRCGVSDRVLFLGQIPEHDVPALLKSAEIFILNSSYEGLPHVVLEAMAAGIPVVACDVGGTAEVVKHGQTGMMVPFGDQAVLRDTLRQLARSAKLRRCLAENANRLIRSEFSEDTCFAKTEGILKLAARAE